MTPSYHSHPYPIHRPNHLTHLGIFPGWDLPALYVYQGTQRPWRVCAHVCMRVCVRSPMTPWCVRVCRWGATSCRTQLRLDGRFSGGGLDADTPHSCWEQVGLQGGAGSGRAEWRWEASGTWAGARGRTN